MRAENLQFDREKHVCYSNEIERIILKHLEGKFSEEDALKYWELIQQQYVRFLETLPYLGGKKNTHNGPGGTYDCIALFAYYENDIDNSS